MQSIILKISLVLCAVVLLHATAFAQGHDKVRKQPSDVATDAKNTEKQDSTRKPKPETADFERWYYGGNLGFSVLNGGFAGNISPLVGYRLKPKCKNYFCRHWRKQYAQLCFHWRWLV